MAKAGRIADAFTCYKHALDIEPRFARAYVGRGAAHVVSGKLNEAAQAFETALRLNPTEPAAADYLKKTREMLNRNKPKPPPSIKSGSQQSHLTATGHTGSAQAHTLSSATGRKGKGVGSEKGPQTQVQVEQAFRAFQQGKLVGTDYLIVSSDDDDSDSDSQGPVVLKRSKRKRDRKGAKTSKKKIKKKTKKDKKFKKKSKKTKKSKGSKHKRKKRRRGGSEQEQEDSGEESLSSDDSASSLSGHPSGSDIDQSHASEAVHVESQVIFNVSSLDSVDVKRQPQGSRQDVEDSNKILMNSDSSSSQPGSSSFSLSLGEGADRDEKARGDMDSTGILETSRDISEETTDF